MNRKDKQPRTKTVKKKIGVFLTPAEWRDVRIACSIAAMLDRTQHCGPVKNHTPGSTLGHALDCASAAIYRRLEQHLNRRAE